jgi:hypothetical protein
MWLEENGKASSGKHTHHFHIKSSILLTWLTGTKSKSNTVQLRIWSQTTWQNLSLVSSLNIFANSLWTYLMQQSLPKIGHQECVGQYMLSQILSQTRPATIIIDQKRF